MVESHFPGLESPGKQATGIWSISTVCCVDSTLYQLDLAGCVCLFRVRSVWPRRLVQESEQSGLKTASVTTTAATVTTATVAATIPPPVTPSCIGMLVLCEYTIATYFCKVHISRIFFSISWHFRRHFKYYLCFDYIFLFGFVTSTMWLATEWHHPCVQTLWKEMG